MARSRKYGGFAPYVSVAERRARAQHTVDTLRNKIPNIQPVVVQGQKLARTWWGQAWNRNLERYADYAYRISRGRSYVRQGAVLDLKIQAGRIKALVQGSQTQPYSIQVIIDPLKGTAWDSVNRACEGTINSLAELLEGKFPKALGELFTAEGKGLFPTPDEIHLQCSCPDWATLCKHAAAALYGVGVRLDENPQLFFELRAVHVEDLVSQVVTEKSQNLLKKAQKKSGRVIEDAADDLGTMFGIDLDPEP